MKELTLNQREQARLEVLNRVLQGWASVREAGQMMGIGERQTWRLLAAYRKDGARAIAHGNRLRRPVNATSPALRERVADLARTMYAGVNHTHLTELLHEREGLLLARSTVRSILLAAGMPSPRRRRPPRHRERRERKAQEGMLLQMDGSVHDWLMDRGPRCTLLLAVDDATGTVPMALFHPLEDTVGYMLLFESIVRRRGIPLAVYTDRHSVFQASSKRWGARTHPAKETPTQFARALRELGVTQIFALSPEAKGRIERANGTFQGRLVAELRLAGASTLEQANAVLSEFVPRYNARFGVPPTQPGLAYRPLPLEVDLPSTLCIKSRRTVAKDNTVLYQRSLLQLFPTVERPSFAGAMVEIQERLNGQLVVTYKGITIPSRTAPPHARLLRDHGVFGLRNGPRAPVNVAAGTAHQPITTEIVLAQVDAARLAWQSQRVKEGMERARQRGQHVGRPRTRDAHLLRPEFREAEQRIRQGTLPAGRAAKELGMGYSTLRRLLARADLQEALTKSLNT